MTEVSEKIQDMIAPLLEGTDMFITGIHIKPVGNVKVYLDADSGLSIEKSAGVNRTLYRLIEAAGLFPDGNFSLEVSSPGIDEPLAGMRQYRKNTGRTLLVVTEDGQELRGTLQAVAEDAITLEVPQAGKKKEAGKKEAIIMEIPFAHIRKSIVQVVF
jgi:ribosome maturation factor RimP